MSDTPDLGKAPQIFITMTECERRIAEAVASEREACAQLADREANRVLDRRASAGVRQLRQQDDQAWMANWIAAAIRARGKIRDLYT